MLFWDLRTPTETISAVDESPANHVWYHNGTEIDTNNRSSSGSMLERGLEFEVPFPPYRSIKKPRRSDNFASNTSSSSVSDWASLPEDILFLVLQKLFEPIDHVRLATVCKHWENVSKLHNDTTKRWRNLLPMLMIPSRSTTKQTVYSLSGGETYTNIQLPVPYDRRFCGSSHGWLATAHENFAITLLNPFGTAAAIHLPPLTTPQHFPSFFQIELQKRRQDELKKQYPYYVRKVVLSADPSLNPDNYVAVAIYDFYGWLAFIKAGQRGWTYIEDTCLCSDAIFHRNEIYAVGPGGMIASVDVNSSIDPSRTPKAIPLTPLKPMEHPLFPYAAHRAYLVKSTNGELLHVRRFLKPKEGIDQKLGVINFVVYKVLNNGDGTIMKHYLVESIGDDALFLGVNHSTSVLASDFPSCQPNCIYFTNDITDGIMGIYNLADKTVAQHYPLNPSETCIRPPIWIVPPINGLG